MSFDKTKFTANPQLDSEGFAKSNEQIDAELDYRLRLCGYGKALDAFYASREAVTLRKGEYAVISNPPGWREPGMQPITWAELDHDLAQMDVHEELFRQ